MLPSLFYNILDEKTKKYIKKTILGPDKNIETFDTMLDLDKSIFRLFFAGGLNKKDEYEYRPDIIRTDFLNIRKILTKNNTTNKNMIRDNHISFYFFLENKNKTSSDTLFKNLKTQFFEKIDELESKLELVENNKINF